MFHILVINVSLNAVRTAIYIRRYKSVIHTLCDYANILPHKLPHSENLLLNEYYGKTVAA